MVIVLISDILYTFLFISERAAGCPGTYLLTLIYRGDLHVREVGLSEYKTFVSRLMSQDRGFGTSCLLHCGHLTVPDNSEDS